jgi:hypothetical protein
MKREKCNSGNQNNASIKQQDYSYLKLQEMFCSNVVTRFLYNKVMILIFTEHFISDI